MLWFPQSSSRLIAFSATGYAGGHRVDSVELAKCGSTLKSETCLSLQNSIRPIERLFLNRDLDLSDPAEAGTEGSLWAEDRFAEVIIRG